MATASKDRFYTPARAARIAYKARGDGGMLIQFFPRSVQIYCVGARELPWAAEKTEEVPRWVRNRGGSQLVLGDAVRRVEQYRALRKATRAAGASEPYSHLAEAYQAFLAHFHPAHLRELSGYRLRTFNFYAAIRRCPGMFELACSGTSDPELAGGGALAYALSNLAALMPCTPRRPLDLARKLVRQRRRDIALALGVPAKHAGLAVNVMARMPKPSVCIDSLLLIVELLARESAHARKLLAHADRINSAALELLRSENVSHTITPQLFAEVAHDKALDTGWLETWNLLHDTHGLITARGALMPKLRSRAELEALHDTEVERRNRALRLGLGTALPPAPVPSLPGEIEYLGTGLELDEEGRQMHHCVGAYGRRVLEGECYVYRVLRPERCTLSIALAPGPSFCVQQLKRAYNDEPRRADTLARVQRWLSEHSDLAATTAARDLMLRSGAWSRSGYRLNDTAALDERLFAESGTGKTVVSLESIRGLVRGLAAGVPF
jgi:PcfJ-like protein